MVSDAIASAESTAGAAALATSPTVAAAPAATPTVNASSANSSLSIKLRLSYDSFDNQMGSLVQRLARPDVGQTTPAVADQLGELASRFSQLMSATPAGGSSQATLGSFLAALSKSMAPRPFADPAAAAPPSSTPDPVIDTLENASTTPATPRMSATLDYRQVMNLGDSTASIRVQARLGAGAVFAVA